MYRQGLMARGDYYRGDGIFSFIGNALKTVAPILPFGIGTAATAVGSLLGGGAKPSVTRVATPPVNYQQQIGGALPPPPNFYGIQAGGTKFGLTTPPNPKRTFGALSPHRKRRRMNVTNPRALRRAIRRARGFEKLARKVLGFTSPRKPKGRPYFRARAKR